LREDQVEESFCVVWFGIWEAPILGAQGSDGVLPWGLGVGSWAEVSSGGQLSSVVLALYSGDTDSLDKEAKNKWKGYSSFIFSAEISTPENHSPSVLHNQNLFYYFRNAVIAPRNPEKQNLEPP